QEQEVDRFFPPPTDTRSPHSVLRRNRFRRDHGGKLQPWVHRIGRPVGEKSDNRQRRLRACHERPRGSRAAEQRDELAPFQLTKLHALTPAKVTAYWIGEHQVRGLPPCGISVRPMTITDVLTFGARTEVRSFLDINIRPDKRTPAFFAMANVTRKVPVAVEFSRKGLASNRFSGE